MNISWRHIARSALLAVRMPAIALALSLVIGSVIMLISGVSPLEGYRSIITGSFGSPTAIGRTLEAATPLILTGIAVALAFRGGLFNIGADGQFTAGALVAAFVGVILDVPAPWGILPIVVLGGAAGWCVGALAGYLKVKFKAHEVVTTIMLNFIVGNIAIWFLLNPLSAGTEVPGSARVLEGNELPRLSPAFGGLHWGFAIAIVCAVLVTVYLWRTSRGLELRIYGLAPKSARFLGVSRVGAAVAAIGGGGVFAGIAGAGEVLGTYGNMSVPFVTNLGFLGIGVALLGRNHPIGCIIGGVILGALSAGGQQMQFDLGISAHLSEILVGVILLFVTTNIALRRRPAAVTPAVAIAEEKV